MMEVVSPFTGRRGVSLPFSDFCAPLLFESLEGGPLTEALLEVARERRWRYFELRGGREVLPDSAVASEKYHGHKLKLTNGPEALFACFQSSVRRAIRKAQKAGLVVEVSTAWEAMANFYRLHVGTRKRHGLPPQPLSFFRNIHEEIFRKRLGFVVSAKSGSRPIAAAVFFWSGEQGVYKFGASDKRFQELRGNNLVIWEGIKRLAQNGLKTLHFGRSTIGDEGLRRFKLSWGTEEYLIEYFKFALSAQRWQNKTHDGFPVYSHFFRRLPRVVNRAAGSFIYSHLD